MKKKILTVFALLFLLLCACAQTEKELTFEEKMKLPGGTSDTSYVLRDPSIKTFADYEQKSLIEPNADYAVALVRCDDVTHYIFNDWGGDMITFATGNTVTITRLIKTGGPGNLFEENMQIEFMQQYGYRPGEDSESLKNYLDQELGLTSKEFLAKGVGFRHPVDLTDDYDYHMVANSARIVPLDKGEEYLMLHRVKKEHDLNHDKWIGIGGKCEEGESPEECLLREAWEETGLTLTDFRYCGLVTFVSDTWEGEYMHLFQAEGFTGDLRTCDEGDLQWVDREFLDQLPKWEGDRIFLDLMWKQVPFFSLKLSYTGERLTYAALNGKPLKV